MKTLFLDCDGVLADFDQLAGKIFGLHPRKYESTYGTDVFWKRLKEYDDFFYKLQKMKDADDLVNGVIATGLPHKILTGKPQGEWAIDQKQRWGKKHYPKIEMIVCRAREKNKFANPGDILIDDRKHYRKLWEDVGGIFILHTSAKESLEQLKKYV